MAKYASIKGLKDLIVTLDLVKSEVHGGIGEKVYAANVIFTENMLNNWKRVILETAKGRVCASTVLGIQGEFNNTNWEEYDAK